MPSKKRIICMSLFLSVRMVISPVFTFTPVSADHNGEMGLEAGQPGGIAAQRALGLRL